MKEKGSQNRNIEIYGLTIHDERSKDEGPALFNPTDFLYFQTGKYTVLISVGSAGSREHGSYPNNLKGAIHKAKAIIDKNTDVDVYFLSAFHVHNQPLNINSEGGPTIIPVEEFEKISQKETPLDYVRSKCCR
jgi:hypothetical protein